MVGAYDRLIAGSPRPYLDRFVTLVRRMDRNYSAFDSGQFFKWLAGDAGYADGELFAYLWTPNGAETQLTDSEIALLLHVNAAEDEAHVVMLAWSPNRFWDDELLKHVDSALDTVLELARMALGNRRIPVKAYWPKRVESAPVHLFYKRAYLRARQEQNPPGSFRLLSEKDMGDVRLVRFAIFPPTA